MLLFAEGYGKGSCEGIGVVQAGDLSSLNLRDIDGLGDGYLDADAPLLTVLPPRSQTLYRQLERNESVKKLKELASVGIGAVTGANEFFLLAEAEIAEHGYASELFRPAVSKAGDIQGAKLGDNDLKGLADDGRPTRMLLADYSAEAGLLDTVESLIAAGEKAGLDKRYKCKSRDPWWAVPLPKVGTPDALMTYMVGDCPRLVLNEVGAISTNTIHFVCASDGIDPAALVVAFHNSLTLLSAELVGRSYGGGLLKLEPTEAGRLLIPAFSTGLGEHLDAVDRLIREDKLDEVLDLIDGLLLEPLGVSDESIKRLRSARRRLADRRATRSISV